MKSAKHTETDRLPGLISADPAKTFKQHVAKINASDEFFASLARRPDRGPIINLNLLRYRPRGNSEIYDRYGAVAGPEIIKLGGNIVYHGKAITGLDAIYGLDSSWDGVAFVLYPRRASYNMLQRSEAYQGALPDRVAGCYERLLYVLSDGDAIFDCDFSIESLHNNKLIIPHQSGNVFVAELARFHRRDGRKSFIRYAEVASRLIADLGGAPILSVRAEMPIVSEQTWDHFTMIRYPSLKALKSMFESDDWQAANADRMAGLEASIAVISGPTDLP